jgi:hypothetical protein
MDMVRCGKCGFENPPDLKFCGNCGTRLSVVLETPRFEGLASLHIAGSLYLLLSLAFNALVRASPAFIILYASSALLGLYAGYRFYTGRASKYLKIVSPLAIALGLTSTSILFLLGLAIRGVIGPAWIIFLVNAWALWRDRKML